MSQEETLIKNIENGIRAIRLGAKEPKGTLAGVSLNKLKVINEGMYSDLMEKYKKALEDYKKKNDEKL